MKRLLTVVILFALSLTMMAQSNELSDSLKLEALRMRLESKRADTDEMAKAASEAKMAAARKRAEKRMLYKKKVSDFSSAYDVKGLYMSADFSYGYQTSKGTVIYHSAGFRDYGDLMPVEARFTAGWRFSYLAAVGMSAGILYDIRSMKIVNDEFASQYSDHKAWQFDIPLAVNGKLWFTPTKIQPYASLSAGCYVVSATMLLEGGFGADFHILNNLSISAEAGLKATPWPYFEGIVSGYRSSLTPYVKFGVNF